MQLPLTQWTLYGENLPERLFDDETKTPAFSLPGADALGAFADLLGGDEQAEPAAAREGVPYALCGLFAEDIGGELTLAKEIDFGAYSGDRALLTFAHILGSGEIHLDDRCIARFGGDDQAQLRQAYGLTGMPCALAIDVTGALELGRRQTLSIRFSASRPAGVLGAAFLSVTARASLSRMSIVSDAHRRTMTVRARVAAQQAGRYALCVQAIADGAGAALPPARETSVELAAGEEKGVQLSMEVDAPVFVHGQPYAAPALKIQLFSRSKEDQRGGLLCDEALLMCGYGAAAPGSWLPLSREDCLNDPELICARLREMGVFAVSLPMPAPDSLYLALTRWGIAAVQHVSEEIRPMFTRYPCLTLSDASLDDQAPSLEAAAWQMAGSVAFPRAIDSGMSKEEMLLKASGRALEGDSVHDALVWLRAVQIRLRAEAARQGRYRGALCGAQEIRNSDVCDALRTAFSPVHLSALPLNGAWWTRTRLCASLEAFIPKEMLSGETIHALAVLEDDDGNEFARFAAPCKRSGYIGVIEAALPDGPCVLTLRCALLRGGETIEESMLPVYVGDRGPLEAAF